MADGKLVVRVRLTPKSSVDRIDGAQSLPDGRAVLLVRVRALPERGAATAALVAKALKLPKSGLSLVAGDRGRVKTVQASGDAATLRHAHDRLRLSLDCPVAPLALVRSGQD